MSILPPLLPVQLQPPTRLKTIHICSETVMENENHRQPSMKHSLTLSLIPKETILISRGTLHRKLYLCTAICNINTENIMCTAQVN